MIMVHLRTVVIIAVLVPLVVSTWPSGYNRQSRRTSWGRSQSGGSSNRSPKTASYSSSYSAPSPLSSRQTASSSWPSSSSPSRSYSSPSRSYSSPSRQQSSRSRSYSSPSRQQSSPSRQQTSPSGSYSSPSRQQSSPSRKQSSLSRSYSSPWTGNTPSPNSISYNFPNDPKWKRKRYPSYAERCGTCEGEPWNKVCGSDGKTYMNQCQLEKISCQKYWDIKVVSMGACQPTCPGVELGMYSGWGLSRASNNGYCNHDFFRCCKAARRKGLPANTVRSCCQARADQCFAFVASTPWRSGITKYGK